MIYQAYNLSPNQEMFDFSIPSSIRIDEDTEVTASTKGTRLVDQNYSAAERYTSVLVAAGTKGYYYEKEAHDNFFLKYLDGSQGEGTYYVLNQDKILRDVPKKLPEEYEAGKDYYYSDGYYEKPFTFYINGSTNLLGLRVKIYNNANNELYYDSGVIQNGDIKITNKKNLIVYEISPSLTGAKINLAPLGTRGEDVRVDLKLPISPKREDFVNKIVNEPDVSLYWVLTQYYATTVTGELDLTKYVENSPALLYPRQKPCLALRYYHQSSGGNIKWVDSLAELGRWPYKDISVAVMPCFYTNEWLGTPALGDYFKAPLVGGTWEVVPYNNDGTVDENGVSVEKIQGAILDYRFSHLSVSPFPGESRSYYFTLTPSYLNKSLNGYEVLSLGTKVGTTNEIVFVKSTETVVAPQYKTTNLKDVLNFKAEVCNNKNYIELLWNKALHLGAYYDSSGNLVAGENLNPYFIDYGSYNAGLGPIGRTLSSIYLPVGNKLIYNDLDVKGGSNQLYLRFNNRDNLIGNFCTIRRADGSTISLNFVKQDDKIVLQLDDNGVKTIPTFAIEGVENTPIECNSQTWQTIGVNLSSQVTNKIYLLNYGVSSNGAELLSENARNCVLYPGETLDGAFLGNPNGSKKYGATGVSLVSYSTSEGAQGDYIENSDVSFCPQNIPEYVDTTGVELPSVNEGNLFLLLKDNGANKKGIYLWTNNAYVFQSAVVGKTYRISREFLKDKKVIKYYDYYILPSENSGEYTRVCENYFYPNAVAVKDSTASWGITGETIESIPEIETSLFQEWCKEIKFANCALDYAIIADLSQSGLGDSSPAEWRAHFTSILKYSLLPIYQVEEAGRVIAEGKPRREDLGSDFLANYDGVLSATEVKVGNEIVDSWRIARVDFSGKREEVALLPLDCSRIRDYSINNNWSGYYEIIPSSLNYIGETVYYGYPSEMSTNWWNYSLLVLGDEDENGNRPVETVFYWNLNATTGDITNNTAFNVQETLSRFKRISKSQTNAISGSLQSLVGYTENGKYHGDAIEVINKLYEIQMSDKTKVLKDRNGRNYVIEFTSPITFTQDNNACINTTYSYNGNSKPVSIQPSTIKINWIEVGKFEDIKAIEILN